MFDIDKQRIRLDSKRGRLIMQQQDGREVLRDRMLRYLEVYDGISPSMLHTGIGAAIPAAVWRPILDELVREGLVLIATTKAHGREYPILLLTTPKAPSTPKLRQV